MASVTAPGLSPAVARPAPLTIAASNGRERGYVVWFCADRGFGWVRADDDTDLFMSFRELPGSGFRCVTAGERVSFVRDHDHHGAVARAVAVLARPEAPERSGCDRSGDHPGRA